MLMLGSPNINAFLDRQEYWDTGDSWCAKHTSDTALLLGIMHSIFHRELQRLETQHHCQKSSSVNT